MPRTLLVAAVALVVIAARPAAHQTKTPPPAAAPVIVLDTVQGMVEIEMYPEDAPKSVEMIVNLAKKGFYRGLRFHRITDALAQVGDPQTRNMMLREYLGKAGSGAPVMVAEISRKHLHVRGAVGLAHTGDARSADSQIYIMKVGSTSLDGKHAVIGHVIKGMDAVDKLEELDVIRNVTVR